MKTVQIVITDTSQRLRRALANEAKTSRVSVSTIVSDVLANTYQVNGRIVERNRSHYTGPPQGSRLVVRVSDQTRQALREAAAKQGATISGLAKSALSDHYGLGALNPNRRKPQRRTP
jgi:predicted HicB family RNase H-like nuclease